MTLQEAQENVDRWIKEYGVRYFNELTNMAILTEEVGEVARIIARRYGEQSFKESDKQIDLADELADVLWVLICLANQTGVDLTEALQKNIDKKTSRDNRRHKDNEMLKGYDTDLRDDEISQITETILHEGLRENCNEEVYRFLFGCIDLTSLNPTDNQNQIAEFTRQVNELDNQNPELNHVAAICVYPNFVECVRMNLEVSDVNIAAVAGGFPSAQTFTEVKIAEAALAVAEGANEIDIVMNVGQFLSGEYEDICDDIAEIKHSCHGDARLKVILETGALGNYSNIKKRPYSPYIPVLTLSKLLPEN